MKKYAKKYLKGCLLGVLLLLALIAGSADAEYEMDHGYRIVIGADGRYGLQGEDGNMALEILYDEIGGFSLWPDGEARCLVMQDGCYGWFPAKDGGASPCIFNEEPQPYSDYVICEDRIWDLNGNSVSEALYAKITILSEDRLAVWSFTGSLEQWEELGDSWGGRMDCAAEHATILNEKLETISELKCDYIKPANGGLCVFTDFDENDDDCWTEGYADLDGNICFSARSQWSFENFCGDYARILRNGSGGMNLLNRNFEKVFDEEYEWIGVFDGGYMALCDGRWSENGKTCVGYRCTFINDQLETLMTFEIGTDINGFWSNGRIIVNDGDYGLYYVHDLNKKLLLKGKYVGEITEEDRVRYQNEAGLWGYIDGNGVNVIPAAYTDAKDFSEGFAAVRDGQGKWSFIAPDGSEVFNQKWDYVESFRDGYAYVREVNESYMIDAQGRRVRPVMRNLDGVPSDDERPQTSAEPWDGSIQTVYAEHCGMRIFQGVDGRCGVMDAAGNILAEAIYDRIEPAREVADGVYRVSLMRDGRYGWCGSDGFCDAQWTSVSEELFAGCSIVTAKSDAFGALSEFYLVDAKGQYIDNVVYESLKVVGEGLLAMREKGGKVVFVVDESFRQVFSLECDEIYSQSEGLFSFSRDGLWGACDQAGSVVVQPISAQSLTFADGYAVITAYNQRSGEDEYGLIDAMGNTVIELGVYPNIYGFENGYCIIRTEDRSYPTASGVLRPYHLYRVVDTQLNLLCEFTGNCHDNRSGELILYFDRDGEFIIDIHGNVVFKAEHIGAWSCGFSRYMEDELYGYLDENANIILTAQYAEAGQFAENGLAPVRLSGSETWLYINTRGETVLAGSWQSAGDFSRDGLAVVTDADGEWYINEKGERIAPYIIDENDMWF